MKLQNAMRLLASVALLGVLVAGCEKAEPDTLPATQAAAKKQPGADTPPAAVNTSAQAKKAKTGD